MNIADYIPHGKENAISRANLMQLTGATDSYIRGCIAKARAEGIHIITGINGKYYISDNADEIESFLEREIQSRINALYFNYRNMREFVNAEKGKKVTKVREHFRTVGNGVYEGQIKI
jgi:hypothetical protein